MIGPLRRHRVVHNSYEPDDVDALVKKLEDRLKVRDFRIGQLEAIAAGKTPPMMTPEVHDIVHAETIAAQAEAEHPDGPSGLDSISTSDLIKLVREHPGVSLNVPFVGPDGIDYADVSTMLADRAEKLEADREAADLAGPPYVGQIRILEADLVRMTADRDSHQRVCMDLMQELAHEKHESDRMAVYVEGEAVVRRKLRDQITALEAKFAKRKAGA